MSDTQRKKVSKADTLPNGGRLLPTLYNMHGISIPEVSADVILLHHPEDEKDKLFEIAAEQKLEEALDIGNEEKIHFRSSFL